MGSRACFVARSNLHSMQLMVLLCIHPFGPSRFGVAVDSTRKWIDG
jgi:hypothetical protein